MAVARGLLGLMMLATVLPAEAGEGGLSHYPYGALTTYAAFQPPRGQSAFYGYLAHYDVSSVRDGDGNAIPGLEGDVFALAPRFIHTWPIDWGGFSISSGFVLQALDVELRLGNIEDRGTGVSLLGFEPFNLTRAITDRLHFFNSILFYFALGNYEPNDLTNYTLNHDSMAWSWALTWLPTADWELSLNGAMEFKQENEDTGYRGGTQGGLTWGFGYKLPNRKWDIGASGFYTDQFRDDRIDGNKVPGGDRTYKLAAGPKLVYWFNPGTAVVLQWHREFESENAPRGDILWLECAIPF